MSGNALEVAKTIDDVALQVSTAFMAEGAGFSKALTVAKGVNDLRAALTPEVMQDMMALMNTSVGFRTDRDPKQINSKTGKPHEPYPMEVVKDCLIEACLRGFYPVNNEFNIIADRFYGCMNGFDRLVRTHPKVTNFRDFFGLPQMNGQGGAIVKARADWHQDGHAQSLEREFAIRVNLGMGADAVIGKAKRKLYAAVYARLTGVVTEDSDAIEVEATVTAQAAPTAEAMFGKATAAKEEDQIPGAEVPAKKPAVAEEPKPETPQQAIARVMGECKVSVDDFMSFIQTKGLVKDASIYPSFESLPFKVCEQWNASPKLAAECIKKFGQVQAK